MAETTIWQMFLTETDLLKLKRAGQNQKHIELLKLLEKICSWIWRLKYILNVKRYNKEMFKRAGSDSALLLREKALAYATFVLAHTELSISATNTFVSYPFGTELSYSALPYGKPYLQCHQHFWPHDRPCAKSSLQSYATAQRILITQNFQIKCVSIKNQD